MVLDYLCFILLLSGCLEICLKWKFQNKNKVIINITNMVDSRVCFFFCFSSRIKHQSQNAYLIENGGKKNKIKKLSNDHKKAFGVFF